MNKTQFGQWPSPITAQSVAATGTRLAEASIENETIYWLESRPQEQGRTSLVSFDGSTQQDVLPPPWNIRSKAHEYGGGAYCVRNNKVFFVNGEDQNIYQFNVDDTQGPEALTQDDGRYADLFFDSKKRILYCVEELHLGSQAKDVKNQLVGFRIEPEKITKILIHDKHDFYSSPSTSPCGRWISWLCWDHPNMPWDASQCYVAALRSNGDVSEPRIVAGNGEESIFQPQWGPSGDLFWVSDKSNWWNLYTLSKKSLNSSESAKQVSFLEAECATPQWTFNMSTYSFTSATEIVVCFSREGFWSLHQLDLTTGLLTEHHTELTQISSIQSRNGQTVFLGSNASQPSNVFVLDGKSLKNITQFKCELEPSWYSQPKPFSFETTHDEVAHAFFYPPTNPNISATKGAKPPVIVLCHGGPTGATSPDLNNKIQFWTSRGFAVIDVNYRGSTGYGRAYRRSLYRYWGIKDVADVCMAAKHAVNQGWIHPKQKVIKGSSAGGFTVLAALTQTRFFDAGTSLYGIGDLDILVHDTHKFEAHYMDTLIAPYETDKKTYFNRSPLHKVDRLNCPLLLFQGLKDAVVPPNQAELFFTASKTTGRPVAYFTYPEEGHGFRRGDTIEHMLEAELYFYQRIFGLEKNTKPDFFIHNLDDTTSKS